MTGPSAFDDWLRRNPDPVAIARGVTLQEIRLHRPAALVMGHVVDARQAKTPFAQPGDHLVHERLPGIQFLERALRIHPGEATPIGPGAGLLPQQKPCTSTMSAAGIGQPSCSDIYSDPFFASRLRHPARHVLCVHR